MRMRGTKKPSSGFSVNIPTKGNGPLWLNALLPAMGFFRTKRTEYGNRQRKGAFYLEMRKIQKNKGGKV